MKAHIAANKVLKEAEDRQTELIAPVAERSMPAPRGGGHPKPDESEQATVKKIRAAVIRSSLQRREMRSGGGCRIVARAHKRERCGDDRRKQQLASRQAASSSPRDAYRP